MVVIRSRLDRLGIVAGLTGSSVLAIGSVVAGLAYRGAAGEPYSPVNHWVSELGERGVSVLAPVFNAALVVGGLGFVVFMIALAMARGTGSAILYGLVGVATGIAGTGVGLFPMNERGAHALVALTFFNLGWIAVGLASIDFVRRADPRFPRWLSGIGAATVLAFVAFLVSLRTEGLLDGAGLAASDVRRTFWIVPTLEWAVIVGIIAWVLFTANAWRRAIR